MNEVEAKAREIAKDRGHKNVDEVVVASDGERIPIWMFYFGKAKRALKTAQDKP